MTDRPVECSNCKKDVKVFYKEVLHGTTSCSEMCADCPILNQKLHGGSNLSPTLNEKEASLYCAGCMTALESIKTGFPLGCSQCYSVFDLILVQELIDQNKIPSRVQKDISDQRSFPIHLGKSPQNANTIPSFTRLHSLNEALNDALKKENYEQAAWLRDQINEIMEKNHDR